MDKKVLLVFLAIAFLVLFASQTQALVPLRCGNVLLGGFPEAQSPDGFILGMGGVYGRAKNVKVGDVICVRFNLMHNSNKVIKFDSNGVFVGARLNSTNDANNRDFGHQYRNYSWSLNQKFINFEATKIVDRPGVWRFWPAYHINGHYGPFRWHEVVVNVGN
ncbi:hypothetical protein V4D30_03880 [Thermodesulfovibrio sp. 3907-1M]|uniref:Uncharacterized protein n=1 Tax=Thermodesulfovibrio autotrophicus TaxID=3118333 RepID=A0AAU8GYG6_9BACT